jgi:hypothetical protein
MIQIASPIDLTAIVERLEVYGRGMWRTPE